MGGSPQALKEVQNERITYRDDSYKHQDIYTQQNRSASVSRPQRKSKIKKKAERQIGKDRGQSKREGEGVNSSRIQREKPERPERRPNEGGRERRLAGRESLKEDTAIEVKRNDEEQKNDLKRTDHPSSHGETSSQPLSPMEFQHHLAGPP